jgi:hypothetical protein
MRSDLEKHSVRRINRLEGFNQVVMSISRTLLSGLSQKFLDYEETFGILSSGRRSGVCLRSVKPYD